MLLAACLVATMVGAAFGAEPAKCCFDKQFSANLGEFGGTVTNGHPYHIEGCVELGYDFYRLLQGSVAHMRQPNSTATVTTIELKDYANRKVYKWAPLKACTWRAMDQIEEMIPPCIPDNARFLGTGELGYGTHNVVINTWEFMNQGMQIQMALTPSCVPVIETVLVGPTEISLFWTGYHPGLHNDLTPPSNCTQAYSYMNYLVM